MKRPPCKSEVAFSQKCLARREESSDSLKTVNPSNSICEDLRTPSSGYGKPWRQIAQEINRKTFKRLRELELLITKKIATEQGGQR